MPILFQWQDLFVPWYEVILIACCILSFWFLSLFVFRDFDLETHCLLCWNRRNFRRRSQHFCQQCPEPFERRHRVQNLILRNRRGRRFCEKLTEWKAAWWTWWSFVIMFWFFLMVQVFGTAWIKLINDCLHFVGPFLLNRTLKIKFGWK